MKKIITLGLTSAIVLSVGTTAFAATPVQAANLTSTGKDAIYESIGKYQNFIDEDGDGICDNTGMYIGSGRGNGRGKNGGRFVDNDGDGLNDNIGSGAGGYFTDADGDGQCDNIGSGAGGYFTDADGDGQCDNIGTAQGANSGQGQRMGQARNRA